MTIGFDKPLYILPFDHRASFQTGLFGWSGTPSAAQTADIAAAKRVVYDGFKAAVASVPGFVGFAVGRTTFWDPLVGLLAKKTTRDAAVAEIARRFREWVDTFEQARARA